MFKIITTKNLIILNGHIYEKKKKMKRNQQKITFMAKPALKTCEIGRSLFLCSLE